jgi:hypothetical protein
MDGILHKEFEGRFFKLGNQSFKRYIFKLRQMHWQKLHQSEAIDPFMLADTLFNIPVMDWSLDNLCSST